MSGNTQVIVVMMMMMIVIMEIIILILIVHIFQVVICTIRYLTFLIPYFSPFDTGIWNRIEYQYLSLLREKDYIFYF